MKVFLDYHHNDLYYSMHCLFEKRLGWEIYRPTGLDWYYQGYWKLGELHQDFQYTDFMLNPGGVMDKYWIPGWNYKKDGIYYLFDGIHEYYHKAITLDQFKAMKFDIIISSVEMHEKPFINLRDKFQSKAKLIAHIGNFKQKSCFANIIYSTKSSFGNCKNEVVIHQELDVNLYKHIGPNLSTKNIFSVVSFLPYKEIFIKYQNLLSGINMKAYGGYCPDGGLFGARGVSAKMQEANIGWHLKPLGGLGHSTMGWAYSGRPIITNMNQHFLNGGESLSLLEPNVTCHDIEAYSEHENCKIIRKIINTDQQIKLGNRLKKRFHELIDYNEDEQNARIFFERIL